MADKSTGLSKVCANLAVGAVEWRDRCKFIEPGRYNTQIKARILIITM